LSIRITSAVWKNVSYGGGDLLVLLALADYADEAGKCWPNVRSIAEKARLGMRQTANIIAKLRNDGIIAVQPGGGRGVSSHYQFNLGTLQPNSLKQDSLKQDSVKYATETLQSSSENTAISSSAIRKNRHESSLEPSGGFSKSQFKGKPGDPDPNCTRCGGTGKFYRKGAPQIESEGCACACRWGYKVTAMGA
jgi:hypothetical protein